MTAFFNGTSSTNVMPDPRHASFRQWILRIIQLRLSQAPLTRSSTTFYAVSATGDESGSDTSNVRALSNLQDDLDAATGDEAFLVKRGETWRTSAGLSVPDDLDNITIGTWGNGFKPRITCYTNTATSGWTQAGATNRWTRSLATQPGWVKDTLYAGLAPYVYCTSTADVEAIPRSWYWDDAGDELHVNSGDGIDPNDLTIEWNDASTSQDDGIIVNNCDGVRIDGLYLDGWGAVAGSSQQFYGIKTIGVGEHLTVITNCEAYDFGRHGIALYNNVATAGGLLYIIGCSVGHGNDTTAGANGYNGFASGGGQEYVVAYSKCRFGALPKSTLYEQQSAFAPWYGHTGGDDAKLAIIFACESGDGEGVPNATWPEGCHSFDSTQIADIDPADPDTWIDCRSFVVDCRSDSRRIGTSGSPVSWGTVDANTIAINCHHKVLHSRVNTNAAKALLGVHLNCILDVEAPAENQNVRMGGDHTGAGTWAGCYIRHQCKSGRSEINNNATGMGGSTIINSALVSETPSGFRLTASDLTTFPDLSANAYYNAASSTSSDSNAVTLTRPPDGFYAMPGSDLYKAGRGSHFMPEYDFFWQQRSTSTPSIGPVEDASLVGPPHRCNSLPMLPSLNLGMFSGALG